MWNPQRAKRERACKDETGLSYCRRFAGGLAFVFPLSILAEWE